MLCGRRSRDESAGAVPAFVFPREPEVALGVEETCCPREFETTSVSRRRALVRNKARPVPRSSRSISPFCVLTDNDFEGVLGLCALDRAEPRPHEREAHLGGDPPAGAPLMHPPVRLEIDRSHAEHCALKLQQYARHAIQSGLGHADVELEVVRAAAIRPSDRRALAVEESRGPCEQLLIEWLR